MAITYGFQLRGSRRVLDLNFLDLKHGKLSYFFLSIFNKIRRVFNITEVELARHKSERPIDD